MKKLTAIVMGVCLVSLVACNNNKPAEQPEAEAAQTEQTAPADQHAPATDAPATEATQTAE